MLSSHTFDTIVTRVFYLSNKSLPHSTLNLLLTTSHDSQYVTWGFASEFGRLGCHGNGSFEPVFDKNLRRLVA